MTIITTITINHNTKTLPPPLTSPYSLQYDYCKAVLQIRIRRIRIISLDPDL